MQNKAMEADLLNKQNEKFRMERAKKLEKELEQATKEHSGSIKRPPERKDSRKPSSSSMKGASVADEKLSTTSICPSTVVESLVS